MSSDAKYELPIFHSIKQLCMWLRGNDAGEAVLRDYAREWLECTPAGQELLAEALDRYTPRRDVLVVIGNEGAFGKRWIEVYTSGHVRVHIAQKLLTPCEILADEYLDATLPDHFRKLHTPSRLRSTQVIEPRTAENELECRISLAVVRELREIAKCKPCEQS